MLLRNRRGESDDRVTSVHRRQQEKDQIHNERGDISFENSNHVTWF